MYADEQKQTIRSTILAQYVRCAGLMCLPRKEVIHPQLPLRIPCYDLTPVIKFTLGQLLVEPISGAPDFRGLTGGVYKTWERIHGDVLTHRY